MGLTREVANYVACTRYRDISPEVVYLAKGFVLDGLGVALAGSTDECARIVEAHVCQMAAKEEATVLGTRLAAPVPKAALANGVAGHAMDYDDTQLSTSKEAVYGLLTHPTTPVLAAVLAIGEKRRISGEEFLLAYLTGVEVKCRIADAINPRQSGWISFHRDHGRLGRGNADGQNPPPQRSGVDSHLGHRSQHGLGVEGKLRHDDQAVACGSRSGKRRHRRAAGAGGIHIGHEYPGSAARLLPCGRLR
jgi:MmgE/PrpD N-terminal domain